MSHHSGQDDPESIRHLNKMFSLGETGKFPLGKIHKTDEGELRLAVGHANGKVVMSFGKSVAWIGFTKEEALTLANSIINHAAEL